MKDPLGWISLHRRLQNHWLWEDKPFSKGQAWADLLLYANHSEKTIYIKNTTIALARGQQARSMLTLCDAWGWSRGKVKRFLEMLENDRMIVQQPNSCTTVITVCNYSDFQGSDKQEKQEAVQQTGSRQDNGQYSRQDINNKVIINNKDNKKTPNKFSDDDFKCAEFISNLIKQLNPDQKEPNLNQWADDIRLMRTVDKRDHRDICAVFKFANQDSFWQSNVLSVKALRKQFDKLSIQKSGASNERRNGHSQTNSKPRKLSAAERVKEHALREIREIENNQPMGGDGGCVRSQVDVELRGDTGSGQCMDGVLEGHFSTAD